MSAERTPIRRVISANVVTGVPNTNDFRWLQKKKSKGLRSRELGNQAKGPSRSIHLPKYVASLTFNFLRKMSFFSCIWNRSSERVVTMMIDMKEAITVTQFLLKMFREINICHKPEFPLNTFGLAIHQNDHQARRRFVQWAQNEIAVVPDFHKRILFSDEAHFWLNGYVNKQNCRVWSEANPQVYVETPLHREKLTVWCALWTGGILLQKR
ncbi:DUF4817 domain-containing protein [Trichonephila clavipes]|nr:DUF4817 domain-containing protein [Trichonephila clavipes]